MDKPNLPAETLDRVEVVYAVKASFVVDAGVYNGVPDKECLAGLINSMGVDADHIDEISIIEVSIDDQVVARA